MPSRHEIIENLRSDLQEAKEKFEGARREATELLANGIPTDLAHPDGMLHIRQVLQRESEAWTAYYECVQKLNRFSVHGVLGEPEAKPKTP